MRRSRARRSFVVLVVIAVSLAGAIAHAQYRASLQGTVSDAQSAAIPGATVTLVDKETNRTLTAVTDANGVYVFNALAPRPYTIEVELTGFKKAVLQDVQIRGEQANTLDVTLEIGGASETVNVAAVAPLIDTATASVAGTVTTQQIQTMPSAGRDVLQLLQLAPGAFGTGARNPGGTENLPGTTIGGSGGATGIFATENGGQITANGARTGENNYQIDGVGVTSVSWGGTTVITPNEDAIKEVKVITNNYDAENGRYRGAQVQIISQNGTNDLHGSAFFKVNRPGLNAFQKYNGYGRAVQKDTALYNDIGGTVGGPIARNKLFAFFSYETIRNDAASIVQGWYQTPQYMALAARSGSAAERFLTFPGSSPAEGTVLMGAGDSHGCADIGLVENVNCRFIEGQGLDVGRPLNSSFSLGARDPSHVDRFTPGLGGDGTNSPSNLDGVADLQWRANINPTKSKAQQYNVRVDFNVTNSDLIAFSMFRVPQSSDAFNGSTREMNAFHHTQLNEAETVIWNRVFSSSMLNEARANVAGWNWKDLDNNPDGPWGLPSVYIQRVDSSATLGTIPDGDNKLDFGIGAPGLFDQKTIGVKNTLTKVMKSHTIKLGGEITRMTFVDTAPWSARPSYYFNNMWDFLNDAPSAENATFDPRTGVPTDFRKDTRQTLYALFVQDNYRVRPNLTLTLGLRWERFGSIREKNDNLSSVVLGEGANALIDMSLRLGGTLYEVNKTDFGPQLGATWSPTRFKDKMVLRGGFGIGYNGLDQAISLNGRSNAPFLSAAGNLTGSQIVYGVNSFPSDVNSFSGYASNPATIASFDPDTNLPTPGPNFALIAVTGFPAKWPTTRSYRYSVDASYDLGRQWVATVGYQGSTTRNLTRQYNLNLVYAAQGIPLNPVVNGVDWYANDGKARFNALLTEVRHRFSNSFELSAQYRLSESLDDGSNNFFTDNYQYDPSASYAPSDYDVTHALKVFGVWSPQIFKDSNSWAEKLIGGWTISGILNATSGFPWTPVYNNIGCGVIYAESGGNGGGWNCALRPAAYLGGAGNGYSVDAFRQPGGNFPNGGAAYFTEPARTQGPSFNDVASGAAAPGPVPQAPGVGRNSFRGPRYFNIDATVNKAFGLPAIKGVGQTPKVEIRAGFYNLFNRINLKSNIQNDILNEHFGEAQEGLAGRVVELQARFSF
jgi:hypothetical protein